MSGAMFVHEKLRTARQERRLSVRQLGALAGVHYAAVWRYETGHATPGVSALASLVQVLGIDPRDLFPAGAGGARRGRRRAGPPGP